MTENEEFASPLVPLVLSEFLVLHDEPVFSHHDNVAELPRMIESATK